MSEAEHLLLDLLDDPSFVRWIEGKGDKAEQEKWKKWQEENPLHKEVRQKALSLYMLPLKETQGEDIQQELEQLHSRIDERSYIFRLPNTTRRSGSMYKKAVAASVVLLIVIVTFLTIYSQQSSKEVKTVPLYSNIEVGYGEKANLKISDGSRIRINSNSSLRYNPEQFNQSQVEMWLEGEAHFSIVKNPGGKKRNFIVHTPDGDIRILGTRFNVNTRFEQTGVVLEEGSIEILVTSSADSGISGKFKLKPGQRAQFSSTQSNVQIQEVDTLLYTAWLNGKLEFKDTPLVDIVNNIEQTYGISIVIKDTTLSNEKISGSLRNPDLITLFEGLEATLNIEIEKQKDDLYEISKASK